MKYQLIDGFEAITESNYWEIQWQIGDAHDRLHDIDCLGMLDYLMDLSQKYKARTDQPMTPSQLRYRRREAIDMYRTFRWYKALNEHNRRVFSGLVLPEQELLAAAHQSAIRDRAQKFADSLNAATAREAPVKQSTV